MVLNSGPSGSIRPDCAALRHRDRAPDRQMDGAAATLAAFRRRPPAAGAEIDRLLEVAVDPGMVKRAAVRPGLAPGGIVGRRVALQAAVDCGASVYCQIASDIHAQTPDLLVRVRRMRPLSACERGIPRHREDFEIVVDDARIGRQERHRPRVGGALLPRGDLRRQSVRAGIPRHRP